MNTQTQLQSAPRPHDLERLVGAVAYKKHWSFQLLDEYYRGQDCSGLTLRILVDVPDAYGHGMLTISHLFIVPAAAYNFRSWQRWLFDRIMDVEKHEAMEFFELEDSNGNNQKPYAPMHGPGNDPYQLVEYAPEIERRTSSRGEVHDA